MIFDLHCDTLSELYKKKISGEPYSLYCSGLSVDTEKLVLGNYMAQCFAVWSTERFENPYLSALEMIDIFNSETKKFEILAPAYNYNDILKNREGGKISAILSLEDCAPIGEDMERFYNLYERGVRMMGLVWNYPNRVGYPNADISLPETDPLRQEPNTKDGLTDFGRQLVSEMNKAGVIIDVSHLSDRGFFEVCEISEKPFVASHSNARGLCPNIRNLTDGMLKKIAEHGGVVGLNYYPPFLSSDDRRGRQTVQRITEQIIYIGKLIGYDYIALGSDFDGIPKGAELSYASDMPKLVEGLWESGFSETVIEKIASENALRLFRETL